MKITKTINEHIFRGYDIRGIYEKDLTLDVAYTIGLAFGTKLKNEKKESAIIGYDNRTSSPLLFNALATGITKTGINVTCLGLVTTPMYYYALTLLKATAGIMITGSHNPKEYNGFKVTFNGIYNAYGEDIQQFKTLVLSGNFSTGKGQIINQDLTNPYLDYITAKIKLGPYKPKIVVDCGNGTPSIIIKEVLNRLAIDYYPLYCESNPNYPHHHPDPSVNKNLIDLKRKVISLKADAGFAYDGDGDRVGMVDEKGQTIPADHFMIIMIRHLIHKLKDKRFLFDVKCSNALTDEIIKLGGTPICYRTGNSYLRAKIYNDNIKFGGELSGHIFFNDHFHGFDDGIYSSLRMLEIISHTKQPVSSLLIGINQYYATEELKLKTTDEIKFKQIEQVKEYCLKKGYQIITLDGCKAIFNDGFALIRASNTEPNLTLRFEAKTKARLNEIQTEFETLLKKLTSP